MSTKELSFKSDLIDITLTADEADWLMSTLGDWIRRYAITTSEVEALTAIAHKVIESGQEDPEEAKAQWAALVAGDAFIGTPSLPTEPLI